MRAILRPVEVNHAINTCKRCAVTLVAVRIQLLLGEDVAAVLSQQQCQTRSSISLSIIAISPSWVFQSA